MLELIQRLGYAPRYCAWELTLACDMRCRHCGSSAGRGRQDELSLDACLDVADQLMAMGCEKLSLSGGEPTLHPHWEAIGRRLARGGVRTNIISNGWQWSRRQAEQARAAGLENAAFSLDGLEAEHDAVRREGSYRRVMAAVEHCAAVGLPVTVVTHINTLNRHRLDDLREVLRHRAVSTWQVQLGVPTGEMETHRDLVIPPDDLLWLIPELVRLREVAAGAPRVVVAENLGYFGKHEPALRSPARIPLFIGCRAGCQVIGIESNGNVKGCLSLPSSGPAGPRFVEGNLQQESLETIWSRRSAFRVNREFTEAALGHFCAVCRYGDICRGGCSWTAYSHTGSCHDNPYCFYRQAVLHGRLELLGDDRPSAEELAFAERMARGQGPPPTGHRRSQDH